MILSSRGSVLQVLNGKLVAPKTGDHKLLFLFDNDIKQIFAFSLS